MFRGTLRPHRCDCCVVVELLSPFLVPYPLLTGFKEKTREVPLYIVPLRGLEIKLSDDKDMSFSSPLGIKFSFHCTTQVRPV